MNSHNYEICEILIEKLSQNELLRDYCSTNFKKTPKFFLGMDARKPPINDDLPVVVIYPEGATLEDNVAIGNDIFIGCAISDTTASTLGSVTKYSGFKCIEEFEYLVYNCIENAMNEYNQKFSIMNDNDVRFTSHYPEFHSQRLLKIISQKE